MVIAQVPRRFVREEWGGTETVILETSKRILAAGHSTAIVCPNALADRDGEEIGGVPVRRFSYFYPYLGLSSEAKVLMDKKGGNLFSFPLMGELLRWPELDLIHLHTLKRTGGIGRYVARRRGIPYVVSLHGGVFDVPVAEAATFTEPTRGAFEWGKALGWWVGSNRVLADAACILCVGDSERKATGERYPGNRVEWLPNGVDVRRFACGDGPAFRARFGIPADAFVVLTVGRIDGQKNQLLPVRALKELRRIQPRTHLLLIGPVTNPAYRQQLEQEIRERELGAQVTLIPGLDNAGNDLTDAYHAADLFLLPSMHEPFGIVILEAWAAGLPVLASHVGGIPSFVENGTDGILFAPSEEREFTESYAGLAKNADLRRRIAEAGRKKATEHFDWDRITSRLLNIYAEVIRPTS
ncbi:MAG: glycosyltransferase family 4 protein [Capsulimonadales bacterium]|nr:glycosyltransferase family 4 protein [Capsulimonadales bacterium]